MNNDILTVLSVSPIYIAILGLMVIPMTLYVGFYRRKNKVDIGDNNDALLMRRVRSHANFIENVPLALILIITVELTGGENALVHGLGATLVIARILHFLGLSRLGPFICRPIGVLGTLAVYLVSSAWILYAFFY